MLVVRERATYSWPCVKTESRRSIATCRRDCPCALLMVMAKANRTGNCSRDRVKKSSLLDVSLQRYSKRYCPSNSPPFRRTSRQWREARVTVMRDPLQSPWLGSMFRSSMIGAPIQSSRWANGRPGTLRLPRNSAVYSSRPAAFSLRSAVSCESNASMGRSI